MACINDLIRRAIKEGKSDGQYAYVAPYLSQSKNIAWSYLLKFAEPIIEKKNESELWVMLINGARIRLFGADNAEALRGLFLDGIVLDEFADMRPKVWSEIIRPLLADRKGWCTFIGTPKGHNNFWEIYKRGEQEPNWYVKVLRASQTGLLDADELADARKMMDENQYLQEFECDFESAIVGAYYGKEMREVTDQGRIQHIKVDPDYPTYTFFDLGYSDSTAIWFAQFIGNEIRVVDYHSSNGHNVQYYIELLEEKGYKYGLHFLPHDARAKTLASNKSIIEQMAEGLGLKNMRIVPSLSIQDGIQAVRMLFPKIFFDFKCEEGIECLRQYQREWDDDKRCFKDKPRHDWTSHGADAFRMMAIAYQKDPEIKKPDDAIIGLTVGDNQVSLEQLWKTVNPPQRGRI